jgi:hypothetical protein
MMRRVSELHLDRSRGYTIRVETRPRTAETPRVRMVHHLRRTMSASATAVMANAAGSQEESTGTSTLTDPTVS